MNTTNERREYFRIEDKAIVHLEKISADKFNNAEQILKEHALSAFLLGSSFAALDLDYQAVMAKVKRSAPDINLYLELINKKLDLITEHLLASDPIMKSNASDVNLSASGLSIITDETFEVDDYIQIKLILEPKKVGVLAFGRVIRSDSENGKYHVSIDFEHIRESDQELIIKHTLNKQLEDARAHKRYD